MKMRPFFRGGALMLLIGSGFRAGAAEEPLALSQARTALGEALPQVALMKLQSVLATETLDAGQRADALRLLAEAQRAVGQRADALATLEQLGSPDAATLLLRADIFASDARWSEALAAYQQARQTSEAPASAVVGEAESLHALGRTAEAIKVLEPQVRSGIASVAAQLRLASYCVELRDAGKARALWRRIEAAEPGDALWLRYLDGRILLLEGDAGAALTRFEEIAAVKEGLSENLLVAATIGISRARGILNGWEAADQPLETFIWRYPESTWLELVFQQLDQVYAQQRRPAESELQKWSVKPQLRRAALAQFYLARLQIRGGKTEKAFSSMEAFIRNFPAHPLKPQVHIMRSDLYQTGGQFSAAVAALEAAERLTTDEAVRGEIELRKGIVHYRQREFLLAATSLDRAAARNPRLRDIATYDAALAWLNQANDERFLDEYRALSERSPESDLRAHLSLERGLVQARQADGRAMETLQRFITEFPRHARVPEAQLAIAELALAQDARSEASRYLRAAGEARTSPVTQDHAAYFAIHLADAQEPRDDAKVIEQALKFIREYGASPLLPEVRMKLGQIYFRQQDYPKAEEQFEWVAREKRENPYAGAALFLAGQCAMQMIDARAVERALGYFDEVAKSRSPLRLYARQQQAIIQSRLGREGEALLLYDVILGTTPPPEPEIRYAALCGKGDNLLALGRKDPAQIEAALATFDDLIAAPNVPPSWRNQALYKKAKALEQLGRAPEALEVYYDVLDQTIRANEREYFWFYKAGFDVARLFEQRSEWSAAVGIYDKMAKLDGPRAQEVRDSARRLRLDHFLPWE